MKRTIGMSVVAGVLSLGSLAGCSSTENQSVAVEDHLTMHSSWGKDGVYRLGAGDALGNELFTYYMASVRAREQYASGSSDFEADD